MAADDFKPGNGANRGCGGKPEPNPLILLGAAGEVGLMVAGMTILGWWLDGQWGTRPWLTLAGVAMGIGGGMYNLWRVSRKFF
ncbi:MAG: AtpZ/AtpI family protein [Phycisphaeraceae bacterium]